MIPRIDCSGDEAVKKGPPLGIKLIRQLRGKDASLKSYRYSVLFMTFIAYACYHASRKPFSVVKSVLDDTDVDVMTLNQTHVAMYRYLPVNPLVSTQSGANGSYRSHGFYDSQTRLHGSGLQSDNETMTGSHPGGLGGWAPFNKKSGKGLLGDVDLAFLASYSIGMYFAGHLGDRLDLRLFLTTGMVGSGFFVCLFGLGYWFNIHSLVYFLVVQMLAGVLQSTGWPSVVSIVGKWFGRRKRGLIMGIWNAHTSVGNILGSVLAAGALPYGWGWSFLLPGLLQAAGGILMFLFLVVEPADVGIRISGDGEEEQFPPEVISNARVESSGKDDIEAGTLDKTARPECSIVVSSPSADTRNTSSEDEETRLLQSPNEETPALTTNYGAVGFVQAWNIPGVAPFAFCLFFSKLVAYTFLNWLPFYITQTKIAGVYLNEKTAGYLSTLFDVGGVVGGILAGHVSDKLDARAITAAGFMYSAIPALFCYRTYGQVSLATNIVLMMIAGMLVNGPYALITTAVSADLGTHASLKGNPRALATVTAIIDGTGSVGAAIGPLLTGYISQVSWDLVFVLLMVAALMAGLLLTRLVIAEVAMKINETHPVLSKDLIRQEDGGGSLTQHLLNGRQ